MDAILHYTALIFVANSLPAKHTAEPTSLKVGKLIISNLLRKAVATS
ncbi:hypothetical protein SAMN05421823_1212 [Catalinimonas alkaloidigena]|uniref:Uncharacterized protein n=1 Tax=Catalinimonas alkaloidigena TaxID=1075417 RepID=A0A1G9VID1_9BACT|nr:hypothetical protein SAMN05421823_1212 [Catalinimonas alkaloidigena]